MLFVLTGSWTGQEENKRIAVEVDNNSPEEALEVVRRFYPGFHQVECFPVHDFLEYRQM